MAHSDLGNASFDAALFLNPSEQELLTTALSSNKPSATTQGRMATKPTPGKKSPASRKDTLTSPVQQTPGSGSLEDLSFDNSPFLDYDLDDSNFDWDTNAQMVGALPGGQEGESPEDDDDDHNDKRNRSEDLDDDEDGGGKRRESEDKIGKKPGRKPLTSEPTTKRKAQNRAAQRAFRERKERHLKELESKVEDLEKAGDSANHENGLLRAQVERLQSELKEYRKRLSVNSTVRTSPQAAPLGLSAKTNWDISNNFQFAFPKFGSMASPQSNGLSPGLNLDNAFPMASPASTASNTQAADHTFPTNTTTDDLGGLFSPSVLASASSVSGSDYLSFTNTNSGTHQQARRNTNKSIGRAQSDSNTNSPASSASHHGFMSSNATTPESCADSPDQRKASEAAFNAISGGGETQTSESGNQEAFSSAATTANQPNTPGLETQSLDWFANQNGGAFDPVLFGDYRDPQENIMNSDFGGNFFNDAFPLSDFDPLTQSLEPAQHQKGRELIQQIEDTQAGKDPEVVPGDKAKLFLTCNMLWDRVQRSQKVQSGEADMDDLCSQLKSKAKCSGNGAVIEQTDVDAILGPAPLDQKDFFKMFK